MAKARLVRPLQSSEATEGKARATQQQKKAMTAGTNQATDPDSVQSSSGVRSRREGAEGSPGLKRNRLPPSSVIQVQRFLPGPPVTRGPLTSGPRTSSPRFISAHLLPANEGSELSRDQLSQVTNCLVPCGPSAQQKQASIRSSAKPESSESSSRNYGGLRQQHDQLELSARASKACGQVTPVSSKACEGCHQSNKSKSNKHSTTKNNNTEIQVDNKHSRSERQQRLPLTAAVWATQAPGSMGLTGSVLGIVKQPLLAVPGSQHLATTNLIGLKKTGQ